MTSFFIIILCSLYCLEYSRYSNAFDWESQVQNLTAKHKFFWGVATSAYQVEGAWNQDGKGESMWDDYSHRYPHRIADQSNGDITCDSYNNLNRDLQMVSRLNVDYYRVSISWSRILPDGGLGGKINEKGLRYYHKLFDALIQKNITPIVTIYHWDLPKTLHFFGGWQNKEIVDYFEKYARVLFENFGDKIKMWVTVNEPYHICEMGYGDHIYAPEDYVPGVSRYLCMHNLLKAHARVYHMYNQEFRPKQNGIIGFVTSCIFTVPYSDSQEDIDAAERGTASIGWALNPIFSSTGDYPEIMKESVAKVSKLEGLSKSRLPEFSNDEVEYIKGSADFLGINYYTSRLTKADNTLVTSNPSFFNDMRITLHIDPNWEQTSTSWLQIAPEGFKSALEYVKKSYNNPITIITEIGCTGSTDSEVEQAIKYYKEHINILYQAITDGMNIRGFLAWSLMDSFEWDSGYTLSFGLYETNFSDPKRSTKIKKSGIFYRHLNQIAKETRQEHGITLQSPAEIIMDKSSASSNYLKSSLFYFISILCLYKLFILNINFIY